MNKNKIEAIHAFIDDVLNDMSNIKTNTTKADLFAYIDAWRTNLNAIKTITE